MEEITQAGIVLEAAKPNALQRVASGTPADLLRVAVAQGADLDKLERLMAMQERWEANEARKAFTVAMTEFKAEPLEIFKRKEVAFLDVKYKHAELADVTDVLVPALSRHSLSHRWNVRQEGDRIIVDCVLTHVLGHSETVTMEAKADTSGKKNQIQAIASAVQYLQRYTFLAATGMATKSAHPDDDGRGAGDEESEADPLLDEFRAAALEGHESLKALYFKTQDDAALWKAKGEKLWAKHGAGLKDAATKAEADAKGQA